jgi:hydroxypyruvate isomerase
MLRFAANLTMMYGEHTFPDRFAAAACDGFTGVEYLFPYEHPAENLAAWLKENALIQVLFNAPPGDWAAGERGLAAVPGKEAAFRDAIATALKYAHVLNCPQVHVMAGIQPAGVERALLLRTFVNNLAWAAEEASRAGVVLLIEPINTRDMPGYFLNRQDEAHAIVEEIASPALKVQMDLYHCQIVEGDICTKLKKYLKKVGHIQIASVPARNEPNAGELDYNYVLALVEDLGYEGWIGCEYRPKGETSEGLDWLRKRR